MRTYFGSLAFGLTAFAASASRAQTQQALQTCVSQAQTGASLAACASRFPKSAAPHIALGRLAKLRGDLKAAAAEFAVATRLDPSSALAAGELGLTRSALHDYTGALPALHRAARLAPRDASILFTLFQCQLALKQFDDAGATAQRIVAISPAVPEMFNRLAREQIQAEDYRHAVAQFERLVELDPNNATSRYNLALSRFKAGDAAGALRAIEPLRGDASAEVESLLGDVFECLDRPLDAAHAYQRAAELAPANEDYRFDFILEMLRHDAFGAAEAVAQRAVVDFPDSQRLYLALAVALYGGQQAEKCANVLFEAVPRFSDPAPLFPMLVQAVEAVRTRMDDAESLLRDYLAGHPGNEQTLYLAGRLAVTRNDPERAAGLLAHAVALNPHDSDARVQLGMAYQALGRTPAAIEQYRKAASASPENSQAWYRLAQALRSNGDKAGATEALKHFSVLRAHEDKQKAVVGFLYTLR